MAGIAGVAAAVPGSAGVAGAAGVAGVAGVAAVGSAALLGPLPGLARTGVTANGTASAVASRTAAVRDIDMGSSFNCPLARP